jgi:tryptophan-rich sensory protein
MSLKKFLDSEKNIVKSPKVSSDIQTSDETLGQEIYEKNLEKETRQLSEGEPNYFRMVTNLGFIFRLLLVIGLTIASVILLLNTTQDTDKDSWFNLLYKPDWAPDGVIITVITSFFAFVFAWIWYITAIHLSGKNAFFINILFLGVYITVFLWSYYFFYKNNLEVARWLSYGIVAGFAILFIITSYFLRLFSPSVLLIFNLAWWIVIMFYSIQSKELTKEFKILGLVKEDMNNSLYRQKLKLEMAYGITITPEGQKIEFNPDDQE